MCTIMLLVIPPPAHISTCILPFETIFPSDHSGIHSGVTTYLVKGRESLQILLHSSMSHQLSTHVLYTYTYTYTYTYIVIYLYKSSPLYSLLQIRDFLPHMRPFLPSNIGAGMTLSPACPTIKFACAAAAAHHRVGKTDYAPRIDFCFCVS